MGKGVSFAAFPNSCFFAMNPTAYGLPARSLHGERLGHPPEWSAQLARSISGQGMKSRLHDV
jgi:hypothetical protein